VIKLKDLITEAEKLQINQNKAFNIAKKTFKEIEKAQKSKNLHIEKMKDANRIETLKSWYYAWSFTVFAGGAFDHLSGEPRVVIVNVAATPAESIKVGDVKVNWHPKFRASHYKGWNKVKYYLRNR
tara:strand:- start:3622 stop:3999 length:378 start_codon:yes stop_codon:yes gene_type:complete